MAKNEKEIVKSESRGNAIFCTCECVRMNQCVICGA